MKPEPTQSKEDLLTMVRSSLTQANQNAKNASRRNSILILLSIIASSAVTLVAAIPAAGGPRIGNWEITCTIAALLGFVASICTGFNQVAGYAAKQARALQGVGRFQALEVALALDGADVHALAKDYQMLVAEYASETR